MLRCIHLFRYVATASKEQGTKSKVRSLCAMPFALAEALRCRVTFSHLRMSVQKV